MSFKLAESVAVITGASSGIGLALARAFARHGARQVLAARRADALEDAARQCRDLGGEAVAVPTDVSDPAAVERLAQRAIDTYGGFDIWVNNAAVSLFSRIDDGPVEAHRRVIEINLLGYMYGSRAAIGHFRQRRRGMLIDVSSGAAYVGQPFVSAYAASKFAIRGLGESLRQEMSDYPDIHVCTVFPASTDTPLFQHAGNYVGRTAQPLPFMDDAETVSDAIVRLVGRPRREVYVGGVRALPTVKALAPAWIERYVGRLVRKKHFLDDAAPASAGSLFEPMAEGTEASGGWRDSKKQR